MSEKISKPLATDTFAAKQETVSSAEPIKKALDQTLPKEPSKPAYKYQYQRDKDNEKVKGIFKFYEVPGATLSFPYKAYKGDEVVRYDLVDGQVYTIPLGVARHLNKNGWYPVHAYTKSEDDKPSMKIGQKVRRFGFQSLEFVDIEDISEHGSPLLTVQYADNVL